MAFLSFTKANGKNYVYLKQYAKADRFYSKNERYIYNFGRLNVALYNMNKWMRNFDMFPEELKLKGFNESDLLKWIAILREKKQLEKKDEGKKRAVF